MNLQSHLHLFVQHTKTLNIAFACNENDLENVDNLPYLHDLIF